MIQTYHPAPTFIRARYPPNYGEGLEMGAWLERGRLGSAFPSPPLPRSPRASWELKTTNESALHTVLATVSVIQSAGIVGWGQRQLPPVVYMCHPGQPWGEDARP